MANVVPLIFEIQGHVMEEYGFEGDDEGFAAFAAELKKWEDDESFGRLSLELKTVMKELTKVGQENEEEDEEEGEEEEAENEVN